MQKHLLWFVSVVFASCSMPARDIASKVSIPEGITVDTIPFKFHSSGRIIISPYIGGVPYDFIFDTGAQVTAVGHNIPLVRVYADTEVIIRDGNNNQWASRRGDLDTLQVGRLTFTGLNSVLQTGLSVDGILGNDVLRHLAWKVDFARRQIYVAKNIHDILTDTTGGVRFRLRDNLPFTVGLLNDYQIHPLVDTGWDSFFSMQTEMLSEDFQKSPFNVATWFRTFDKGDIFSDPIDTLLDRKVDTVHYAVADLAIGSQVLRDEIIGFGHYSSNQILGMDFLRRFSFVVFDYPGRKMYFGDPQFKSLSYLHATVDFNSMGVGLSQDTIPIVLSVTPLAARLGVHIGDTVMAIDGVPFYNQPPSFHEASVHDGALTPSVYDLVINQFRLRNLTGSLLLKRGEDTQEVGLSRTLGFDVELIPDTVIHFTDGVLQHPGYIITGTRSVNNGTASYYVITTRKPPFGLGGNDQ